MKIRVTHIIIAFVYLLLLIFLYLWGIDAVEKKINFEFFADSETYMELAQGELGLVEMLLFNPNLIGPVFIVRTLLLNYYLIFIFQAFIFLHSFNLVTKYYNVNRYMLLFLWFISPMMTFSILTINKEIYSVYALCFFLAYLQSNKSRHLILSIIIGCFVRYQLILFIILAYVFIRTTPIKKHKNLFILLFLLSLSIIIPLTPEIFEVYNVLSQQVTDNSEGSGLFNSFNIIQSQFFGYIIVFIPKLSFQLFGMISKISKFGNMDENFYNYTIIIYQSILNLFVFLFCFYKKINLRNDLVFLGLVYCIIFNLSPTSQPRYFFLFYVIFSIVISQRDYFLKNTRNLRLEQS